MLNRQDVVADAPYDHPDHGRVVVVLIDSSDDTVYYEQANDRHTNSQFTHMHSDDLDTFRRIVDPLSQTLDLPGATATADTSMGGG